MRFFFFTDPLQAYCMLNEIMPDLIFLDINMPEMDGFEFPDKMQGENNRTKVYMLTSSCSEKERQQSFEYANVVDFLSKPLRTDQVEKILSLKE